MDNAAALPQAGNWKNWHTYIVYGADLLRQRTVVTVRDPKSNVQPRHPLRDHKQETASSAAQDTNRQSSLTANAYYNASHRTMVEEVKKPSRHTRLVQFIPLAGLSSVDSMFTTRVTNKEVRTSGVFGNIRTLSFDTTGSRHRLLQCMSPTNDT